MISQIIMSIQIYTGSLPPLSSHQKPICNMLRYLLIFLPLVLAIDSNGQALPSELMSTNSCSSLIQDKLNDITAKEPLLKGFMFNAPSYSFVDATSINFYSILANKPIDYTKLNPLATVGDL